MSYVLGHTTMFYVTCKFDQFMHNATAENADAIAFQGVCWYINNP